MKTKESLYLKEALAQTPRLLSLMDRNEYSRTFGCFYRIFWHDKVTDIASAHPQIGVLVLALLYKHKLLFNPYFRNEKIKKWCVGGMNFWTKIQNSDGSFNEHYPNEHSFGATAWTLSAILDSYLLLEKEIPSDEKIKILNSAEKASEWLMKHDDPGPLTNHITISALALYNMYKVSKKKKFLKGAYEKIKNVLELQSPEGWFLEYDGADFGYLTTTISFLARYYKETKDKRVFDSLKKAILFSSYFVYPDCSYGGIVGSRQTFHFHPTGFEIMAREIPIAGIITDKILKGIENNAILTPKIIDDKHLPNLLIEFLQSYIYSSRSFSKQKLPFESLPFKKYFKHAKILVIKNPLYYVITNLGKGGVFYLFDIKKSKLILSDSGICGFIKKNKLVSSNWLDDSYDIEIKDSEVGVAGNFHEIPLETLSSFKMIASRVALLTIARRTATSTFIKKRLIERLITKSKKIPLKFKRRLIFGQKKIDIEDKIEGEELISLKISPEFLPRFVPASRYFQERELTFPSPNLDGAIEKFKKTGSITIKRSIEFPRTRISFSIC